MDIFANLANLEWQQVVMWIIGGVLMVVAHYLVAGNTSTITNLIL